MFKTLYRCPRTVARHESGPLFESRLKYLEHLAAGGSTIHTLRGIAGVIYRAAVTLNLDETSPVERSMIEKAAYEWGRRPFRNASLEAPDQSEKEFRLITCSWLRFAGRLQDSDRVAVPHADKINLFCTHMEQEQGLAKPTIITARGYLIKFMQRSQLSDLKTLDLCYIDRYLSNLGAQGWTRHGLCTLAYHLRRFLRFTEQQGWTRPGIAAGIHGPRTYRHEQLPLGPSWPDVQRLLQSTLTDRKTDIRDRAILLLLAVYGLRVGEVIRLKIKDIDWSAKTMNVVQTKQRRSRVCPLIPSLATAIRRYLDEVRPPVAYPELFLRVNAPHRPFGNSGLYGIVAWRLKRLGISSPKISPHSLRHACATHLLNEGFTLTEVAGHLGHQSIESTRVYAKVDLATLRAVADLDLGGLL